MLLGLFVLAALGFFYHRVLDRHGRPRLIGELATGAVIVLAVFAIAANDAWHFGMVTTTTTTVTPLPTQTVMRQPLGTKDAAYRFHTADRTVEARPNLTTTVLLTRGGRAGTFTTTTQRLRYANSVAKVMFAGSGLDGHVTGQKLTLNLPASWQVHEQ